MTDNTLAIEVRGLAKRFADVLAQKAKEWDELMRTFQETVPGAPEGSTWVLMKEVYALEAD